MATYLNPIQVGFGTKGGCEAAVHAARTYVDENINKNVLLLKIDFMNAFNCVERDTLLERIREKIPSLYPFLWQAYSEPSVLMFGDRPISSEVGLQQGDPAGPLCFSLVIQPIIQEIKTDLNLWYLDDGLLGGDPNEVLLCFTNLIEKCKLLGLRINPGKCELFPCEIFDDDILDRFKQVSPGIQIKNELTYLGAPITENCFVSVINEKMTDLNRLFERLKLLKYHVAYFLLKNALYIPKLIYLLRTTPIWLLQSFITDVDTSMLQTVEELFNSRLELQKWNQASLPIRFGGLGIRKIVDVALPAFLSSVNSVFPLVQSMLQTIPDLENIAFYRRAIEQWNVDVPQSLPEKPSIQKDWDELKCKKLVSTLTFPTKEEKALHLASCRQESSAWLNTLPSKSIGTLLENNVFRIAISLRLGSVICKPHKCICGELVSSNGFHGLSCQKSAGRQSRHFLLNDTLKRAFQSARVPAVLEPSGLTREDGRRPDGMTLIPWKNGQSLVWDATCSDTVAPSYLEHSINGAGVVANNAAARKQRKYRSLAESHIFVPFAVETLGPWCKEALALVKSLGSRITSVTAEPRARSFLMQKISIDIQRGNAGCVMGTMPQNCSMQEIFYL